MWKFEREKNKFKEIQKYKHNVYSPKKRSLSEKEISKSKSQINSSKSQYIYTSNIYSYRKVLEIKSYHKNLMNSDH